MIVAQWEKDNVIELFTSIKKFTKAHSAYTYATIYNQLTRKKKAYVDEFVTVSRIEINKTLTIK